MFVSRNPLRVPISSPLLPPSPPPPATASFALCFSVLFALPYMPKHIKLSWRQFTHFVLPPAAGALCGERLLLRYVWLATQLANMSP